MRLDDPLPPPIDKTLESSEEYSLEPVLKTDLNEVEETPKSEEDLLFDKGYMFDPPQPVAEEEEELLLDETSISHQERQELEDYGLMPTDLQSKKERLEMKRKERIDKLNTDDKRDIQPEDVKHQLDEPAFSRKNVKLEDVPHSSDKNLSRLSLNDENQILGNNKYLHDNVD